MVESENGSKSPDIATRIERTHQITSFVTTLLASCGAITALIPITAILLNIFDGDELVSFHISSAISIIVCVFLIISVQNYHKVKVIRLLESIDIAWDDDDPLELDWILGLVESNRGGHLAKEIDAETGAAKYITRAMDEKGPDWGRSDSGFSEHMIRRDAIRRGRKYDGLEGELTDTEIMVADANLVASISAQKRWERAEASDLELIEAGVERLGDLVIQGHFEKTAKEGSMRELIGNGEEE